MQNTLNVRELYKIQKLEEVNEIYFCQCGKNYLTFSALYLHARNKHDVKLTTKKSEKICKVEQIGAKTHITYYINIEASNENRNSDKYQLNFKYNTKNCEQQQSELREDETIDQFLSDYSAREDSSSEETVKIISLFKKYLLEYFVIDGNSDQQTSEFPLYFNDFILNYLPAQSESGYSSRAMRTAAERALVEFWQWLKCNNQTKMELLYCPLV